MPETKQLLPSINAFYMVKTNDDGSVDLYFGATKPAEAPDTNWTDC